MVFPLEERLEQKNALPFKSEGERRIAHFLDSNSIRYQYEPGVLVHTHYGKPRIWYPDFYLTEFSTYIEYYGLVGRESYDRGIKRKQSAYSSMGLSVIPVYPWTFAGNWQKYIMGEMEKRTLQRYKTLMAKPYWSKRGSSSYR